MWNTLKEHNNNNKKKKNKNNNNKKKKKAKYLEINLSSINPIKDIKISSHPYVKYSWSFYKWTLEKFRQVDSENILEEKK